MGWDVVFLFFCYVYIDLTVVRKLDEIIDKSVQSVGVLNERKKKPSS